MGRNWERQIAVVMTEKDERQFMAFLRSTAPISILLPRASTKDQIAIDSLPPRRKRQGQGQGKFYLWNENFGPCTPTLSVDANGYVYVKHSDRSPILEYSRDLLTGWVPHAIGRLYWGRGIDPDGTFRANSAYAFSYDAVAFEKWYKLVVSWVKKNSRVKQINSVKVHYLPSAWLWHGWYVWESKSR
jgi:hypothetical protein